MCERADDPSSIFDINGNAIQSNILYIVDANKQFIPGDNYTEAAPLELVKGDTLTVAGISSAGISVERNNIGDCHILNPIWGDGLDESTGITYRNFQIDVTQQDPCYVYNKDNDSIRLWGRGVDYLENVLYVKTETGFVDVNSATNLQKGNNNNNSENNCYTVYLGDTITIRSYSGTDGYDFNTVGNVDKAYGEVDMWNDPEYFQVGNLIKGDHYVEKTFTPLKVEIQKIALNGGPDPDVKYWDTVCIEVAEPVMENDTIYLKDPITGKLKILNSGETINVYVGDRLEVTSIVNGASGFTVSGNGGASEEKLLRQSHSPTPETAVGPPYVITGGFQAQRVGMAVSANGIQLPRGIR